MTAAVASPAARTGAPARLFPPDAASRARTLEDAVLAAVESRRLRGTAACLVCGEEVDGMAVCDRCGSELS